jgi:hypothetical protein
VERGVDGIFGAAYLTVRSLAKLFAVILATLAIPAALVTGIPFISYLKHSKPLVGASGLLAVAMAAFVVFFVLTAASVAWDWVIPGTGKKIIKWKYLLPGFYAVLLLVLYF